MPSEDMKTAVAPSGLLPALGEVSLAEPPTCTLRVGVTGQRPPKLTDDQIPEIRNAVREVLTFIRGATEDLVKSNLGYARREPRFLIVSSLAEGTDRLVAAEALTLGFRLQCPLPANRDEYRRDFTAPSSAQAFDELLGKAKAVFEFMGQREGTWLEPAAYEAAGRVMLARTDVLITVWDGERGEPAGTAQIVGEAQQAGIPIVRIPRQNPAQIEFLSQAAGAISDWRNELRGALITALAAPDSSRDRVPEFLREAFRRTAGRDPVVEQRDQADQIAKRYAALYRRAYKTVYSLAPMAVLLAIAGWWLLGNRSDTDLELLSTCLELLCIIVILGVTWYGRKRRWHERWLDARAMAEQFRSWAFLAPIAQAPPTSRLPPYVSTKATQRDWTGWCFRARVREHGLSPAVVTPESLAVYQRQLLQVIAGQAQHHQDKGGERKRTYERMELTTAVLFAVTGVACFVHLALPELLRLESVAFLTTLAAVTAVLPAVGSALEGLQGQGEYQRLSERSEGMCRYFTSLQKQVRGPELQPLSYAALAQLAHQVAGVMLDELSDWRSLVRLRSLHPM